MPNIVVIGDAEHGKGTVIEYLCDEFPFLSSSSSSLIACQEFAYEDIKDEFGFTSAMQCWLARRDPKVRAALYQSIRRFNTPDEAALGRLIFANHDIYDGIRRYQECLAMKEAGLYNIAIGVDASERKPLESADSMDRELFSLCDLIIPNNGTLPELHIRIKVIAEFIKGLGV